jgi:hypothetical protein
MSSTTVPITHDQHSAAELTRLEAAVSSALRGVVQGLRHAKTIEDVAEAAARGARELAAIAEQVIL